MEVVIGVVIGWVLAVAREVVAFWWHKREKNRETHESQRSLARLVSDDLVAAQHQLFGVLEGHVAWQEVGISIRWWVDSREGLVNALTKDEWESLRDAYLHVNAINGMTAHRSDVDTPRLKSAAESAVKVLQKANQALATLAT